MKRLQLILFGLFVLGCSGPSDGSALVDGAVTPPSGAVDFNFTASATVHGAGPFRLQILESAKVGREGLPLGRSLELRLPHLPDSDVTLDLAQAIGSAIQVRSIAAGDGSAVEEQETLRRWEDGSFVASPGKGSLLLHFDGTGPGDGVSGTLEIDLGGSGRVSARFAAALAD